MKWIVPLLLVATALAGCSQGAHALDPYVMDTMDAPDGCYYIDLKEDREEAQLAAFLGLRSNPGSIDSEILRYEGFVPKDNRYAFFECKFPSGTHQFASGAIAFEDGGEARAFIDAALDESQVVSCQGQAEVFVQGGVIGAVVSLDQDSWPQPLVTKVEDFLQGQIRAGASDECSRLAGA